LTKKTAPEFEADTIAIVNGFLLAQEKQKYLQSFNLSIPENQ